MLPLKPFLFFLWRLKLILSLGLFSSSVFAEEQVHFGSIFSQDNNYRTETTVQNVNQLTDGSQQQKNLETLYPEIKPENNRLRQIQATPNAPNSSSSQEAMIPSSITYSPENKTRLGVVKNSELERHVVYFIELRPIQSNNAKNLYQNMSTSYAPAARIEPGELVKVVDSGQDFINKMRMDRDNQGIWKQVARKNNGDPTDLFVYYDWKNFDTVLTNQASVELDVLVPRDMSSVPVFSRPGAWTWKDCQLGSDICLDRIDQHAEAFLMDTGFAVVNDMRTRQNVLQLFYKIGYRIHDKEGILRHKIGWIPSYFARRKISMIPKNLLSSNEYGFSGFETDEERLERLSKYYVFEQNMYSDNRLMSRWLKKQPGEKHEVFDNTFNYDYLFGYQSFELDQSFLNETFTQQSALVGLGVYAPLYVDLEVQGTFSLAIPVSFGPDNGLFKATPLFRADQWLMYTTPVGVNDMPLKVGLGLYYLTMFQTDLDFGFKSFVGFQVKAAVENQKFWFDVRYGPTGQDFGFELTNREVGASFGLRLDPARSYDSMTLFLDYGSTTFKSGTSGHTTKFNILSLGLRKTF
ncbi:hypothetical protein K2X05_07570 [bacterium]|nr:hypothetical protein [bacterium]